MIDGVDISKIGLHDLRNKITVIPQESFIFEGTIRENIDPVIEFSDAAIWNALECANLKETVIKLDKSLDHLLTESGDNFGAGERQLICLARAILKNSRIIVLDEATASVYNHSDSSIQHTIRTQFPDSTILTIAHWLNTIMDYDRYSIIYLPSISEEFSFSILVMKAGSAVEFDTPQNILNNTLLFLWHGQKCQFG